MVSDNHAYIKATAPWLLGKETILQANEEVCCGAALNQQQLQGKMYLRPSRVIL